MTMKCKIVYYNFIVLSIESISITVVFKDINISIESDTPNKEKIDSMKYQEKQNADMMKQYQ